MLMHTSLAVLLASSMRGCEDPPLSTIVASPSTIASSALCLHHEQQKYHSISQFNNIH